MLKKKQAGRKASLTEQQMRQCVIWKNQGYTLDSISEEFSVSSETIRRAIAKCKKQGFIGI